MKRQLSWVLDARLCWVVMLMFTVFALTPPSSHAGLMESRLSSGESMSSRAPQLEKVRQALQQEIVAQRLADYGLSVAEVEAKLHTLSDAQLHQLASLSDSLAEGGATGFIIAVLLIVLLVVLILKIHDKRIIIK